MMIKEYFSLTSSERNGLFALCVLALVLLLVLKLRQYTYEPTLVDLGALQDSVQKYYNSPILEEDTVSTVFKGVYTNSKPSQKNPVKLKTKKPLVVVEINSANLEELTQIRGVGEFYAKNIIEVRKRLGGYSKVEQLLNVYGLSQERLDSMLKQIRIDTSLCVPKLPLNTVDSTQLTELYVLDSYMASRVVRYRERLGGFYDTKQLKEIYNFDEEVYGRIMQRVYFDSVELRMIDINNVDFKTLMKHPYISGYKNTKAIFRYLEYGAIKTWEEFCKIPHLELENPEGLRHYVTFLPKQDLEAKRDSLELLKN